MATTDQLAGKVLEIINQVQSGIITHAPDAVSLVLASTQVSCFQRLFWCFCGLLIVTAFIIILFKMKARIDKDKKSVEPHYERLRWSDDGVQISLCAMFVLGTIIGIGSLIGFFSIWNWVGIINPKLYLAHEIIQKVMQ
jgi:hypothetical protein